MVKTVWKEYTRRLNKTGRTRADLSRETRIAYNKLVGFFLGYWNLNAEEMRKVDSLLEQWEKAPEVAEVSNG